MTPRDYRKRHSYDLELVESSQTKSGDHRKERPVHRSMEK